MKKMDLMVGYILLAGVLLSVMFLASGIFWHWISAGSLSLSYALSGMNLFQFWRADFHDLSSGTIGPRSLVNVGIALLLFTPYLRVLASTLYFALAERNVKYTFFTGFVLAVLTYSLFLR
jgi:uncharacterized membrane protein